MEKECPYRAAILEDDKVYREQMKIMLTNYSVRVNMELEIDTFGTSQALFAALEKYEYDFILLDLHLGNDINGIEVGKHLRNRGVKAQIIILTSMECYVLDGYKIGAARYLLKPVSPDQLSEAMDACTIALHKEKRYIPFTIDYRLQVLDVYTILYIESYARKRHIHTTTDTFETIELLKDIAARLPTQFFAHVGTRYLINMEQVKTASKHSIRLSNGHELLISRHFADQFTEQFHQYLNG